MNSRLKRIVEQNTTAGGRAFDVFIQVLIVLTLVDYAVETLPNLQPGTRRILRTLELITVGIFTVEYILRVAVADRPRKFIFSFYGIIDLLAILPFYLALFFPYVALLGVDLRFIRVVRMMRLFRAFKFVRYSKALQLFTRAFDLAKEELALFFLAAAMLIYFAAAGIHFFEHQAQPEAFSSIFSSLWWAVITLTTVGYGDVYPVTVGGRVFTFFLLMIGLGTIAVPSGIVASALSKARELQHDQENDNV